MTDLISAYKVTEYNDMDIFNQGSLVHVRNYFDELEKENNKSHDLLKKTHSRIEDLHSDNKYSINSVHFFVKMILSIIFMIIMCDFLKEGNLDD